MGYSRSLSPLPRPLLRANTFQTTRTYISHYGDKTKAFRSFDPNLKVLLGDALAKACPKGSSQNYRVANMRYNEKTHSFERTGEWTCSEKLDDSLHSAKTFDQNTCNVLLVEGFSLALYEVIGEHFDVHPSFFADHLSVTVTDDTTTSLPSRTRSSFIRGNAMLRYIESMIIEESVDSIPFSSMACADSRRHISVTEIRSEEATGGSTRHEDLPSKSEKKTSVPIALVRRKCSYWKASDTANGFTSKMHVILSRTD